MTLIDQLRARAAGHDPKIELTPAEAAALVAAWEKAVAHDDWFNAPMQEASKLYQVYFPTRVAFREARAKLAHTPAFDQRAYRENDRGVIRFYPSLALLWDDGEWDTTAVSEDGCQREGDTRLSDAEAAAIWATRPQEMNHE